jgi:hypothetical protein
MQQTWVEAATAYLAQAKENVEEEDYIDSRKEKCKVDAI